MTLRPLALVLALAAGCGGCSQFNEAVTVSVAGPTVRAEAGYFEPEPEAEVVAGTRGIDPHKALRSSETLTGRWERQGPSRLATLPAREGTRESRMAAAAEAKAKLQRIERSVRAGMGTVCEGC